MSGPREAQLTIERLFEVLHYELNTGVFRWKVRPNSRVAPGDIAGTIRPDGYRQICVDRVLRRAHRMAWFYVNGTWPDCEIDHRNLITDDNRISNLRVATTVENHQNKRKSRIDSRSGRLGVFRSRSAWVAQIQVDGVHHHLGSFPTAEQAQTAYLSAKTDLHPFWEAAS